MVDVVTPQKSAEERKKEDTDLLVGEVHRSRDELEKQLRMFLEAPTPMNFAHLDGCAQSYMEKVLITLAHIADTETYYRMLKIEVH